jgi:hypothetical protein
MGLVVDEGCSECASVSFDHLLFSPLNEIKLNVTIDGFSLIRRRYSKQCGPLFIV